MAFLIDWFDRLSERRLRRVRMVVMVTVAAAWLELIIITARGAQGGVGMRAAGRRGGDVRRGVLMRGMVVFGFALLADLRVHGGDGGHAEVPFERAGGAGERGEDLGCAQRAATHVGGQGAGQGTGRQLRRMQVEFQLDQALGLAGRGPGTVPLVDLGLHNPVPQSLGIDPQLLAHTAERARPRRWIAP